MKPASAPRHARLVLAMWVPGAVLGAHLALLLFFLNPALEPRWSVLLRAIGALALLFGMASLAVLSIGLARRSRRPLLSPAWATTLALAVAAMLQWIHASLFSYYLPPGLDTRLIKAAAGVSAVTLICFYTALLHAVQRRGWGWRSRYGIGALVMLSLVTTAERRWAYEGSSAPPARTIVRSDAPRPRLLVVAVEGATLDAILPLAEQGRLPFLATILRQGVYGRLQTVAPVRRLPAWHSVSTGVYPFRHGVVSEDTLQAPFLHSRAVLSLPPRWTGLSRWGALLGVRRRGLAPPSRAPALWTILETLGGRISLVGWPSPAAEVAALPQALPESFFTRPGAATATVDGPLRRLAVESRPTVDSVDPRIFTRIAPDASKRIRAAVVSDLWRASVADSLLAGQSGMDAVFLGLPGLLEVSRRFFGGYAAVQFDGDTRADHVAAAQILTGYYAFLDGLLARLWSGLSGPRLLVLVSAYGVREPSGWRRLGSSLSPMSSLGGRIDGGADGVVMLLGDSLRSGSFLDRAVLTDIAPTLLYGLGLPVARDADGKVLTGAFGTTFLSRTPVTFVPSYASIVADAQQPSS